MIPQTIFSIAAVAFAALSSASPVPNDNQARDMDLLLQKRVVVTVTTDNATASITPAVASTEISLDSSDPDPTGGKADIVDAVAGIVDKVATLIQGLVDDDIKRRQRFTQETVAALSVQTPGENVVMSNVGYTISCTPLAVSHSSYKAKVGSNVSFDAVVFGAGCTFTLKGDGGFQNWAYKIQSTCKANGKTLTC